MKILFIADWFTDQFPNGGAEIANDVIIENLTNQGYNVVCRKTGETNTDEINAAELVLVANFLLLSEELKKYLTDNSRYVIIEHDFKMLVARCPLKYKGYYPKQEIINQDFYNKAVKVICQSERHAQTVKQILPECNVTWFDCNPWRESDLDLLEKLSENQKNGYYAILGHGVPQKNTIGAINFCLSQGIDFCLIHPKPYQDYLTSLSKCSGLVFLPLVFETFSRVSFEALCLNLEIIGNENISFLYSEAAQLRGKELINFARQNNKSIVNYLTLKD